MSQGVRQDELQRKTQALLQGPLKHARAAALAAALLPLASVAAAPAEAQACGSGGNVCGFVWNDADNDGIQGPGETGIGGAVVTIDGVPTATNADGFYFFDVEPGDHVIEVQIPPGTQVSLPDQGSDDTIDSDGVPDAVGNSVATFTLNEGEHSKVDFGFVASQTAQPGTGTPGYWKNHPEAWPVEQIAVGGVVYSKAEALSWLDRPGKDKTLTMFSSLVPAKLNVLIGNDASCVQSTIDSADQWMANYGPVGRGVHAASFAWKVGEPLHRQMDNYNNGMLCAPHRD